MGWGGLGPLLMARCLSDRCAGAVGMRASVGWGSFDAAIKRRGVVLLGLLVYALL